MRDARRGRASLWIIALVVFLSVAGHAEQFPAPPPPPPPPPPSPSVFEAAPAEALPIGTGTGLIFGRVVDGVTGRPLGGVLVRLGGTGPIQAPPAAATPTPAMTNAQGQFLFRSLAAGRYPITAQTGGYLPGSYGQTRPEGPPASIRLGEAERLTDVTIRMWKHGAITGRVLDETGEPAVGVMVRPLRRSVVARQGQWILGPGSSNTDDRGIYRLGNLTPGEYVVVTTAGLSTVPASISESYVQAMQSGTPTSLPPAIQEASASPMGAGVRVGDLQVQPFRSTMPPPAGL
jgi:hypothetical protein